MGNPLQTDVIIITYPAAFRKMCGGGKKQKKENNFCCIFAEHAVS